MIVTNADLVFCCECYAAQFNERDESTFMIGQVPMGYRAECFCCGLVENPLADEEFPEE